MKAERMPIVAFVGGLVAVSTLAVVDAVTSVTMFGGLVIGVVVAALAARPRQVAIVGLYACAWSVVLGYESSWFTAPHAGRIALVTLGGAVTVALAVARDRYVRALIRTAHVAEVAQRALLRPLDQRYGGTEVAYRYLSASDGALIGGDIYAVESTAWGLRVIVADVCGHGLDAVDKASTLAHAFGEHAHRATTLRSLADALDESFRRHADGRVDFATGVLLQIVGDNVEIANCGHPDPIVVHDGEMSWLSPRDRSAPFGLHPSPTTSRLVLPGDASLVVYTDGLIEARGRDRTEFFDLEGHVAAAFEHDSLESCLDALVGDLTAHTDGVLVDDVVVLAIRSS